MKKALSFLALMLFTYIVYAGQTVTLNVHQSTRNTTNVYRGIGELTLDDYNAVTGKIEWTIISLDKSIYNQYKNRMNAKGIEFVKGTYNPDTKTFNLHGYEKNDPAGILSLDTYILDLNDPAKVTGTTRGSGKWDGLVEGTYTMSAYVTTNPNAAKADAELQKANASLTPEQKKIKELLDQIVNAYAADRTKSYPFYQYDKNTISDVSVLSRDPAGNPDEVKAMFRFNAGASLGIVYLLMADWVPYFMHFNGDEHYNITPQFKNGDLAKAYTPEALKKIQSLQEKYNNHLDEVEYKKGEASYNKVLAAQAKFPASADIGKFLVPATYVGTQRYKITTPTYTGGYYMNSQGEVESAVVDKVTYEERETSYDGLKNNSSHVIIIRGISLDRVNGETVYVDASITVQPQEIIPYVEIEPACKRDAINGIEPLYFKYTTPVKSTAKGKK